MTARATVSGVRDASGGPGGAAWRVPDERSGGHQYPAVLAYTPVGSDQYDVATVVEGADFLAGTLEKATLSRTLGAQ